MAKKQNNTKLRVMMLGGLNEIGKNIAVLEYGNDMIIVTVGQKDTADPVRVLFQIGDVRDHQIYAKHIVVGERQAAVHNDDVVAVFQNSDVFTDLVQTAQHHNAELGCVLFFCHKAILS